MATGSTGPWFKAAAGGAGNGDFKTFGFADPQTTNSPGGLSSSAGFNQTEWDQCLQGRPASPTPGARRRCFTLQSGDHTGLAGMGSEAETSMKKMKNNPNC